MLKSYAQAVDMVDELNLRTVSLDSTLSLPQSDKLKSPDLLKTLSLYKALGVGEATHGTHEFFVAKANLIKQLILLNKFDRIGLEAPYAEVEVLNRYLEKNEGNLNEILKSFRQYTYETKEFVSLINHIKLYNHTAKVKVFFFGYDFQSPYKALRNIRSVFNTPTAMLAADSLEAAFDTLSNELYSHQVNAEAYRRILNYSEKMYKAVDTLHTPALSKNLNSYRQFLRLNHPHFSSDIQKLSGIRDSIMASNIINELNEGHRMIVWAHNGHVQKTANKFSKSMGQRLAESLRTDYAAIGLTTYKGFYTGYSNLEQGVVNTNRLMPPNPSQIEYYLNQLKHKNFIVKTNGVIAPKIITEHRLLGYGVTNDQFQFGTMVDAFDYIIFISSTTGSWNHYLRKEK